MKRCPRCGETKPFTEFHKHAKRRDGLQSICKSCRAQVDHERYERIRGTRVPTRTWERGRAEWLLSLKAGRPCTDCGRVFPPQVMQWDHLPGLEKLGDISTAFRGHSREEILAEIAKCELVCTNCHTIRTAERAGWVVLSDLADEETRSDSASKALDAQQLPQHIPRSTLCDVPAMEADKRISQFADRPVFILPRVSARLRPSVLPGAWEAGAI